jgi:hypothetical protein
VPMLLLNIADVFGNIRAVHAAAVAVAPECIGVKARYNTQHCQAKRRATNAPLCICTLCVEAPVGRTRQQRPATAACLQAGRTRAVLLSCCCAVYKPSAPLICGCCTSNLP